MCFEKGLVTANAHRLKSGRIFITLRPFKSDGHIVITMKHMKGYASIKVQIGDNKPEVIEVNESLDINRNVNKGNKVSILIELAKHYGSYKILKKDGKANGTSIK